MVAREGLGTLDYELLANPEHIQAVSGLVTAVIYQDVITIKQYALHTVACHFDNRERFRVGTQVDTNPIFPKSHCESWFFVFSDITVPSSDFNVVAGNKYELFNINRSVQGIQNRLSILIAIIGCWLFAVFAIFFEHSPLSGSKPKQIYSSRIGNFNQVRGAGLSTLFYPFGRCRVCHINSSAQLGDAAKSLRNYLHSLCKLNVKVLHTKTNLNL